VRIDIKGLEKVYKGGTRALDGVDLTFGEGTLGLLGPNGAGKTTLMKILATLLQPTAGRVEVDGRDLLRERRIIRDRLGYLPQAFGAPRPIRVHEFVDHMARLKGVPGAARRAKVLEALETVGLAEVKDRKAKKLSGGMVRRLGIAQALVGDPEVLIIDEPTVGLDPEERVHFRHLLQDLSGKMTVLLSTHIVADLSATCSDIAVLDKGRLRYRGSPEEMRKKAEGSVWETECGSEEMQRLEQEHTVVSSLPQDGRFRVRGVGDPPSGASVLPSSEVSLEDAYLCLVGDVQVAASELQAASAEGGVQ